MMSQEKLKSTCAFFGSFQVAHAPPTSSTWVGLLIRQPLSCWPLSLPDRGAPRRYGSPPALHEAAAASAALKPKKTEKRRTAKAARMTS